MDINYAPHGLVFKFVAALKGNQTLFYKLENREEFKNRRGLLNVNQSISAQEALALFLSLEMRIVRLCTLNRQSIKNGFSFQSCQEMKMK